MATIEDLPNEILLRIFEFVPFFHVVNTVSRVCVRWKDLSGQGIPLDLSFNREHMDVVDDMFLSHLSKFRLRQIDLSSATHTAAFDGFQVTASGLACLRNCPTLKSIVIHRRDIGRSALVELLKFQSLESLDIIGSTTGPPIGGHSGGYPLLRSLRRLAASTEAWDWSAFANLEELELHPASENAVMEIVKCPILHSLTLTMARCSFTSLGRLTNLTTLVLKSSLPYIKFQTLQRQTHWMAMSSCISSLVNLRTLELHDLSHDAVNDLFFQHTLPNLPQLERLAVTSDPQDLGLTDNVLEAVATYLPHLHYLRLSPCRAFTDSGVNSVLVACAELTSLLLPNCTSISDRTLEAVVKYTPLLAHIDVSYCLRVTSAGLHLLAVALQGLKSVTLFGAHFAADPNALELLRRRGAVVHYRPPAAQAAGPAVARPQLHPCTCGCKRPSRCACAPVACPACHVAVPVQLQRDHHEFCPKMEISCYLCFEPVRRANLVEHVASCPANVVKCMVCLAWIQRAALPAHAARHDALGGLVAPTACPCCRAPMPLARVRNHMPMCGEWLMICPTCRDDVTRADLEAHRGVCPLRHALPDGKSAPCIEAIAALFHGRQTQVPPGQTDA
eukprot:m.77829 g.77829  ORF g.77829 m.77829 type:complete len:617 (-) comp7931_c0_seq2:163-2013(-)